MLFFQQKIITTVTVFLIVVGCLFFCNVSLYAKAKVNKKADNVSSELPKLIPPRLNIGDTVALVSPGYRVVKDSDIDRAKKRMETLGFKVKLGKYVYSRHGLFAGTDEERAKDINQMFKDKKVKAIVALRGGWGCNRILDLIDYDAIKKNPKIIMGYSDITSLLLAINSKTGLVTFHGPMATLSWPKFTTDYVKDVLCNANCVTFANPEESEDDLIRISHHLSQKSFVKVCEKSGLIQTKNRVMTIRKGKARGKFLGGNLAVLTSMIGSEYLPKFDGAILFVEDIGEPTYRIDRMLCQLKLAGILDKISGFVLGKFTDCKRENGSQTLQEVLDRHLLPLKIPVWNGSMIGHEKKIFTVPEGLEVAIDAEAGTIRMLEPAVK